MAATEKIVEEGYLEDDAAAKEYIMFVFFYLNRNGNPFWKPNRSTDQDD